MFVPGGNLLHFGNPFHRNSLACLMAHVKQTARRNVCFQQVRHVDERHATCYKREDEKVARQLLFFALGLRGCDSAYVLYRQGAFACSRLTRVDVIEKLVVQFRLSRFPCPVANGAKDAEIKRLRILSRAPLFR